MESHGGIPGFQTKEDFLRGVSKPVNPELFSIFRTVGFGEESGHGVPTVVGRYGREAFFFSKNVIDVTIPFETPNAQNNKRVPLKNSPKKSSDKFFSVPLKTALKTSSHSILKPTENEPFESTNMSKKILVFDSKVSPFARSQVITLKSSIAFVSFGSPNNFLKRISYADNMSFQFSMHEIAKKSKREITSI